MTAKRNFAILEWAIVLLPTLLVIILAKIVGLNALWTDGVVYTAVLFAAVISVERPAWREMAFWKSFALVLGGHILILSSLLQMLTLNRFGLPKLVLIPFGIVEGVFILAVLRKRMKTVNTVRGT